MTTVGIITNRFGLPRLLRLIKHLENRLSVQVELLLEESHIFSSKAALPCPCALYFTGGWGPIIRAQALKAEKAGIPVHNCAEGLEIARNRLLTDIVVRAAGVPLPDFALGHERDIHFGEYWIKNQTVQNPPLFLPIACRNGGRKYLDKKIRYFQERFPAEEEEFVTFNLGRETFFFKRDPRKITLLPVPEVPKLQEYTRKVMKAIKLSIASVKFIKSGSKYFFTDVNSAPDFSQVEKGNRILAEWLVQTAREGGSS